MSNLSTSRVFSHDICFVGLKCYGLLSDSAVPKYIGGIERVLVSLAQGLADCGLKVAFIVYDEGQPDYQELHGITVIKSFKVDEGLKFVRFVAPRMTEIWRSMRKADARFYIQMGAGVETFATWLGTRVYAKYSKFIFAIASDANCTQSLSGLQSPYEKWLYKLALKRADAVISQTSSQQELLLKEFAVESSVIAMPCKQPRATQGHSNKESKIQVLWVGRVINVKRLDRYLSLAERNKDYLFHVIGASNSTTKYAEELLGKAKAVPNVIVHGKVSDDELYSLYSCSHVLCCTSDVEGFPTTFLEAWSFRKPVLTTFDPDGVVENYSLGIVCDEASLSESLNRLVSDRTNYNHLCENAYNFYSENYTIESIVPKYFSLLGLNAR